MQILRADQDIIVSNHHAIVAEFEANSNRRYELLATYTREINKQNQVFHERLANLEEENSRLRNEIWEPKSKTREGLTREARLLQENNSLQGYIIKHVHHMADTNLKETESDFRYFQTISLRGNVSS